MAMPNDVARLTLLRREHEILKQIAFCLTAGYEAKKIAQAERSGP